MSLGECERVALATWLDAMGLDNLLAARGDNATTRPTPKPRQVTYLPRKGDKGTHDDGVERTPVRVTKHFRPGDDGVLVVPAVCPDDGAAREVPPGEVEITEKVKR